MTPKTSCTLIPNREFFVVVRQDSMMAKVYFSFRVSIPPLSLSLFLWLSRFDRHLFTGKVAGNYKWNTPFVVHLLNTKGVGMGDSLTGVLYLFGIGSAAFVLLSFEILPLGLYFLVHFEFGIALGIFVTVLNEYRDKVGE